MLHWSDMLPDKLLAPWKHSLRVKGFFFKVHRQVEWSLLQAAFIADDN